LFTYRPYKTEDLDRCARIADQAWPLDQSIVSASDKPLIMKAYVELSYHMSDYSEVCCNDNGAVGFIFCTTVRRRASISQRKALHKLLKAFLAGHYGRINRPFTFLLSFIMNLLKVEFLCRKFTSEVILFAVDNDVRGHGIGRKLMDRYIRYAQRKKQKTVCLYTDIESNWRFYEDYGFVRYRSFKDNELTFEKKHKIMSFIYYYNLPGIRRLTAFKHQQKQAQARAK